MSSLLKLTFDPSYLEIKTIDGSTKLERRKMRGSKDREPNGGAPGLLVEIRYSKKSF